MLFYFLLAILKGEEGSGYSMSILEQAFKNEVIDTLAARNIVIDDDEVIDRIVDILVTDSEDMWDCIISNILKVSGDIISKHLDGEL